MGTLWLSWEICWETLASGSKAEEIQGNLAKTDEILHPTLALGQWLRTCFRTGSGRDLEKPCKHRGNLLNDFGFGPVASNLFAETSRLKRFGATGPKPKLNRRFHRYLQGFSRPLPLPVLKQVRSHWSKAKVGCKTSSVFARFPWIS